VRVDCLVPSLRRADGPGTAGVVRAGVQGVVGPLAKAPANGMNRRQIDDVETHGRDVRQPPGTILEGSVLSRLECAGTGKNLVPGAEAGSFPINEHTQGTVVGKGLTAVRIAGHQGPEGRVESFLHPSSRIAGA